MTEDMGYVDPPATFVGTDDQLVNALRCVAVMHQHSMTIRAVAEAAADRFVEARRAEAAAWNAAIEAAATVGDHYADMDYCAMGYPEDGGIAASGTAHTIRQDIRALRRAAPTEGEAQSLDDTTRAVLDRAERIVAGQSQQEQRTAEIFLRPTEGEA